MQAPQGLQGVMDVMLRDLGAGDVGWLVAQHGEHYAQAEGFDDSFGALVAAILDAYQRDRDPECERAWIAVQDGQRLGSIFCVRVDPETARLRLFLLTPGARGKGIGLRLLRSCMGYARATGYRRMVLSTHESHRAACALYVRNGWRLVKSVPVRSFGVDLVEQSWEIDL